MVTIALSYHRRTLTGDTRPGMERGPPDPPPHSYPQSSLRVMVPGRIAVGKNEMKTWDDGRS